MWVRAIEFARSSGFGFVVGTKTGGCGRYADGKLIDSLTSVSEHSSPSSMFGMVILP